MARPIEKGKNAKNAGQSAPFEMDQVKILSDPCFGQFRRGPCFPRYERKSKQGVAYGTDVTTGAKRLMATLSTMDFVALGSLCSGGIITIFNKGITGGARNGAARLAWFLVGTAIGLYAYGAIGGMLYALNTGNVAASSSRGGSVLFHRTEHPLLFWITFLGLSLATGLIACLSLTCFWKAIKNG
ncbi:hypothetical protein [Rhodanobacter fulvus]|nr:hypothetical protein [Rhodanobacter fulvus]